MMLESRSSWSVLHPSLSPLATILERIHVEMHKPVDLHFESTFIITIVTKSDALLSQLFQVESIVARRRSAGQFWRTREIS